MRERNAEGNKSGALASGRLAAMGRALPYFESWKKANAQNVGKISTPGPYERQVFRTSVNRRCEFQCVRKTWSREHCKAYET